MARLIDADAFCKSNVFVCGGFAEDQYWNGYTDALDRVEEALEYFPEVDAVEVVRCKDCRYWEEETGVCDKLSDMMTSAHLEKGEAMAEYIDRSKLEFDFRQCNRTNSNWTQQRVVQMIHRQPAADVAPVVHGRWIFGTANHREWMKCSECLVSQTPTGVFTYCPNCGARMDGERRSDG